MKVLDQKEVLFLAETSDFRRIVQLQFKSRYIWYTYSTMSDL